MSDTRPAFELAAEAARIALARGDREAARVTLSAAPYRPDPAAGVGSETPDALMRLGGVHQDAGLAAEAERLFGDAVAVAERTLGAEDPVVGRALVRLGNALFARGAHDEAELALTRALKIIDRQSIADDADINVVLNALSRLYLRRNAFEHAAPLLDRLLEMKRIKGEDHPEVATVLASLVLVRQAAGDHEGAEQLGRRVLQIRERTLAPNHYGIASALELLADTCAARGKVAEAVVLHQRALSIREQTLGVSHASLRTSRERIADLQLQAAEEMGDAGYALPIAPASYVTPRAPAGRAVADLGSPAPQLETATPEGLSTRPAPASPAERADVQQMWPAELRPSELQAAIRSANLDRAEPSTAVSVFGDVLSLPDDPGIDGTTPNDYSSRLATLRRFVAPRRMQIAVAGAGLLTLFVAVRIAQPRATADSPSRRSLNTAGTSSVPTPTGAAPRRDGGGTDSSIVATSSGSVALRSSPAAAHPSVPVRETGARARRTSDQDESESLELTRGIRPLPNVALQGTDSLVRLAQPRVGADSFSKQFWTNGLDKKADTDAGSPKNAKLIGDMPQPYYPEFLRKNGVEGEVVVQFTVDQNGRPDVATFEAVRSPHDALTNSVRKVVERMRFEPALTGGPKPLPRTEVVQISFVFKASAK